MINHRSPEFAALLTRTLEGVKRALYTQNDVLFFAASGTGGLEATLVNLLAPGDYVLGVTIGAFGNRFLEIAERFGVQVQRLEYAWGDPADPTDIDRALAANPALKAVLVTHNETSTGVANDLQAIAAVVKRHNRLLAVDAISSAGALPIEVDAWGIDVLVCGSQKAWMTPPGLAWVVVSARAWEAVKANPAPRFYWDFAETKKYQDRGQTPATPAVSNFYALDTALSLMEKEGMERIFARHRRMGALTRRAIKDMGLELLATSPRHYSDTVTAVKIPASHDFKQVSARLQSEFGVVVAGGQGPLAGKILRIGHLGYVTLHDVKHCLNAIGAVLGRPLPFTLR